MRTRRIGDGRRRGRWAASVLVAVATLGLGPVAVPQPARAEDVPAPDDRPTAFVAGTVTEAATGRALSGLCVSSLFDDGSRFPSGGPRARSLGGGGAAEPEERCPENHVTTGEDGTYRLPVDLWVTGQVRVVVSDPSGGWGLWMSAPMALADGDSVEGTDARLARGGSMRGRVVDAVSGAPLEGACPTIMWGRSDEWFSFPSTCTDVDGWWTVSGLPARRFTVFLGMELPYVGMYVPGVVSVRGASLITAVAGRQVTAPLTRLHRGGVLTGTVTDRAGKPVRGIGVTVGRAWPMEGPLPYWAVTDAAGRYRVEGMVEGTSIVWFQGVGGAQARWAWQWSGGVSDPGAAAGVRIAFDTTTTLDAVLRLAGKVEVTVSGVSAQDGGGVDVQAFSASGAWLGIVTSVEPGGAPGVLTGVPDGVVVLRAEQRRDGEVKRRWYVAPGAPKGTRASPVAVRAGRTTSVSWVVDW